MSRSTTYQNLVSPDSFIGQYMAAMEDTETPYAFDFWCAAWCLSVAIGRDLLIARPNAPVFMNMYLLLVAESGIARKSTAVRFATDIVRMASEQEGGPQLGIYQTPLTAKQLTEQCILRTAETGESRLAISVEELVTVLNRSNYTLPGLLTDLYDCPATRSGGTYGGNYRNVYLNFLAASAPSWLATHITPAIIEGGFTSRCLFVVAEDRKRRIAWADANNSGGQIHCRQALAERLVGICRQSRNLRASHGTIPISETARERFVSWYNRKPDEREPFLASFGAREDHHALRLSGILSANDGRWEIQEADIKRSIRLVAEIKRTSGSLFRASAPVNRTLAGIERLRERLVEAGRTGISQTQARIVTQRYLSADQLRLCLHIMQELRMVDSFQMQANHLGRPVTIWRATRTLTNVGAMDMIMKELTPT